MPWASLLAANPTPSGPPVSPELEPRRERWEQRQQWQRPRLRRLHQRSVSKEKWVETLVVADAKMVEYHGQPQVESYVLTIMNMVSLCGPGVGGGDSVGGWGCKEWVQGRKAGRLDPRPRSRPRAGRRVSKLLRQEGVGVLAASHHERAWTEGCCGDTTGCHATGRGSGSGRLRQPQLCACLGAHRLVGSFMLPCTDTSFLCVRTCARCWKHRNA